MKQLLKTAFLSTLPVLTGYLVLGFGFGILLKANGLDATVAIAMSMFVYAGSMQYAAIGLMTQGATFVTIALTTLAVNARHLFYGISMLDKYKSVGKRKGYLIFALTDETYSLVCNDRNDIPENKKKDYYLAVSVMNHIYWIMGTILGVAIGSLIAFDSNGIEFSLTALFLTAFLEQWMSSGKHTSALIGLVATAICLVVFGAERFLIPAMLLIALLLCVIKEDSND